MSPNPVPRDVPYIEYDEVEAICPDCGRLFRSEDALRDHQGEAHAPGGSPVPAEAGTGVKCSVCHETLASISALQRHSRRVHSN